MQSTGTGSFVVLGEAPGRIEDHKGVPFVGPAGQLLRRELAQMGVEDRAVFMNTVSCWPVGEEDTKPTKEQLQACRVNLRDQLDAVDAVYVLACGRVAIEALVPHATSHTRGHLIHIHDQMVFPVYHPSFILHKKSQEIYREWQEELRAFLFLMEFGQLEDTKSTCIYCKAEKYGELDSCYKHRHDLQVDSIWSQTKKHYRKKKGEQVKGQTDLL